MLACAQPGFDGPAILFQNIIEVLHRSMPAILRQSTRGFEPHDGWWITGVLVGVDYARRRMVVSAQGFAEKALSRCWLLLVFGCSGLVSGLSVSHRPGYHPVF